MKFAKSILIAALACAAGLAQAQPVKLKFAVFSPDSERLYNTVKKPWAEAVNKAAGGTIDIEIFPNGALGRAPQQQAQMVLDGVADIGFIVPAFTPGRFPDTEVMELPGLYQDLAEGTRVYTNLVRNGVLKDYGDYFPIAMWSTPPFSFHANYPINTIADLKGRKVRGGGVIQLESVKALGGVPVGMPPTEVPEALSRRTIDASTSQPAVLFDFGLDRVTTHHYFVRLGVVALAVVMNKKKYDSLPAQAQKAIKDHSFDYINKLYIDSMLVYDKQLVQRLRDDPKRKVVFPSASDQKAADAAFEPIIKGWAAKSPHNGEVYQATLAEIQKERARK